MAARSRRPNSNGLDAWPGYVDALSTLLMVIIFVLLVFILAQGVLSNALSGRDKALEELRRDLATLRSDLVQERQRTTSLTAGSADLTRQLAQSDEARRSLTRQVQDLRELTSQLTADRDRLVLREADARLALDSATAAVERLRTAATQANERAEMTAQERDALRTRLGEAERQATETDRVLRGTTEQAARERETARTRLADAERRLQEANQALRALTDEAARERETARARQIDTERRLAEAEQAMRAATDSAGQEREAARARLADAERRLAELDRALRVMTDESTARLQAETRRRETAEAGSASQAAALLAAREELAALRRDVEAQRREAEARQAELSRIAAALDLAQRDARTREIAIAELEQRLSVAVLDRMEQLKRYRSDFFGRLRDILEGRSGIQVVGDRFVFQSEVLFPVGSSELTAVGREQIASLAAAILQIAAQIPSDIPWVLRVDGHSDRSPVRGSTNWELSAARAITVVKFLIAQGVPAERLSAAAFAEFHPLTDGDTPEAKARNRRIELRFTDR